MPNTVERVFFRPFPGRTVPRPGLGSSFPPQGDWCNKDLYMTRRVAGPNVPDPDGEFIPDDKIGDLAPPEEMIGRPINEKAEADDKAAAAAVAADAEREAAK